MSAAIRVMYLVALCGLSTVSAHASQVLAEAVAETHRTPAFVARDEARHPLQTLGFFGVKPYMTVVEIWPGAGWYTEILAPLVRGKGLLYTAHFPDDSSVPFYRTMRTDFVEKLQADPAVYDEVVLAQMAPDGMIKGVPRRSADCVLTFRNMHNFYMGGGDKRVVAAFKGFYRVLKPGGILGVVDHRLPADRPLDDQKGSGYMREDYLISMAEKAGFKLLDTSEINANPRDNASHPSGVWTLPPTYRLGDQDRAKYEAIGESDRMTLKFVKPMRM